MTDSRENYAVPLHASTDALSDVLDLIHPQGKELAVVRTDDGRDVAHPAGERVLHIIEVCPVDIALADGGGERLKSGDTALLATGTAHRLRCPTGGAWMSGRFRVQENTAAPLLAQASKTPAGVAPLRNDPIPLENLCAREVFNHLA